MNAAVDTLEREVAHPTMALVQAITKADLDQQITTAHAFPRSIKRFASACMDMATLSEEVAESCMYALPRGGKTIEGPSARFAEILQSAWGNNRAGARVIDEGAEFVTAQGIFHDLESNSMVTMEVKRRITDRDGKRFNIDMIAVTGNAAAAIAHRNAVLKGVPKAFWDGIYQAARRTAIGDIKSLANKRAEAFEWLQKRHVSEEMALASLGLEGIEDVGLDQLAILKGAISSVKNGEATIETAFAPRETAAPRGKPKTEAPKPKGKSKTVAAAPDRSGEIIAPADAIKVRDALSAEGIGEKDFCKHFGIASIEELPIEQIDAAKTWIGQVSAG